MKLSLACALAHNPRVLILDEATVGLDPMARDEVLDMLQMFVAVEDNGGRPRNAILMSSHITSDLEKIADEVVCIDGGRIVFDRAKDEITDCMGVARCRVAEVRMLVEDQRMPDRMRAMRNDYGVDVLIPNRFEFVRAFPLDRRIDGRRKGASRNGLRCRHARVERGENGECRGGNDGLRAHRNDIERRDPACLL